MTDRTTPDVDTNYSNLVPQAQRHRDRTTPLPIIGDAWFRHSAAATCARSIAYDMQVMADNPDLTGEALTALLRASKSEPDLTSFHSFALGHAGHGLWQDALLTRDETALIEAEGMIADPEDPDGRPLSGCHVDAVVVTIEGVRQAIEVKTVNEYGYKDAVLSGRGPKWGHKVQAALNAQAVGADEAVIVYLPMTSVSVGRAEKTGIAAANRHGAQWTYPKEVWGPWADWEISRVRWVKSQVLEHGAASVPRWWPEKQQAAGDAPNIIEDPSRRAFPCRDYCDRFTQCMKDGA